MAQAITTLEEAEANGSKGPKEAEPPPRAARPEPPAELKSAEPPPPRSEPSPPPEALQEALLAEDAAIEEEMRRLETHERQRGIEDARIRAQLAAPATLGNSGTRSGFEDHASGERAPFSKSLFAPALGRAAGAESSPEASATLSSPALDAARPPEASAPAERARQAARLLLERAREMTRERQLESGKLSLTIRLDEESQLRLTITPRGDGTHELAFMVADPRLRQALERSLPELRSAADELPIDVVDIWIGEVVDEATGPNPEDGGPL